MNHVSKLTFGCAVIAVAGGLVLAKARKAGKLLSLRVTGP
jgi:hypothetical protein